MIDYYPTPIVESLDITGTASIAVSATSQLVCTATYDAEDTTPATEVFTSYVIWTSSNTSIATVSSTGLVTGIGAGSTTITATFTQYFIVDNTKIVTTDTLGITVT